MLGLLEVSEGDRTGTLCDPVAVGRVTLVLAHSKVNSAWVGMASDSEVTVGESHFTTILTRNGNAGSLRPGGVIVTTSMPGR